MKVNKQKLRHNTEYKNYVQEVSLSQTKQLFKGLKQSDFNSKVDKVMLS